MSLAAMVDNPPLLIIEKAHTTFERYTMDTKRREACIEYYKENMVEKFTGYVVSDLWRDLTPQITWPMKIVGFKSRITQK